eukprot:4600162-Amphidinium_carterae.1
MAILSRAEGHNRHSMMRILNIVTCTSGSVHLRSHSNRSQELHRSTSQRGPSTIQRQGTPSWKSFITPKLFNALLLLAGVLSGLISEISDRKSHILASGLFGRTAARALLDTLYSVNGAEPRARDPQRWTSPLVAPCPCTTHVYMSIKIMIKWPCIDVET